MNTKNAGALDILEKSLGGKPTFGRIVEALRLSEEISQTDLAKKMKISRAHLCDIEKGRRNVTLDRAVRFAKVFGRSEKVFVEFAVEDLLRRAGLKFRVHIDAA